MRTLRVFLLPSVFLGALVILVYTLSDFSSSDEPCALGSCPQALFEGDSGKIFKYQNASEFSVRLDERKNSQKDLYCRPGGVIEAVSIMPETPYYTAVFRAITPGTCALESNTFSATIVIQ